MPELLLLLAMGGQAEFSDTRTVIIRKFRRYLEKYTIFHKVYIQINIFLSFLFLFYFIIASGFSSKYRQTNWRYFPISHTREFTMVTFVGWKFEELQLLVQVGWYYAIDLSFIFCSEIAFIKNFVVVILKSRRLVIGDPTKLHRD